MYLAENADNEWLIQTVYDFVNKAESSGIKLSELLNYLY